MIFLMEVRSAHFVTFQDLPTSWDHYAHDNILVAGTWLKCVLYTRRLVACECEKKDYQHVVSTHSR